jgi:AcrR family transcriptional regulator
MQRSRPTKKQVVTEFRHRAILDAAHQVFAARGFESASVDEIARLAGVAKGTLYLYYPSKEAIYRAALRGGLEQLCAELRQRVEAASGVRDKIQAFVETKLAYFDARRDFLRLYLAAFGDLTQPFACHKELKGLYREQMALLEKALRAAPGGTRLAPEAAASAVFDLTRGAIMRRLYGTRRAALDKDVSVLLDLIWKGLAGR